MKKKEYCETKNQIKFVGIHLIVELWEGSGLTSIPKIEKIMQDCVKSCGATLLKIDLHKFSPSGGITGVAILQESHISIHTWPEYRYAAFDIFLCGNLDPFQAVAVLKKGFKTNHIQISEFKRGVLPNA
ncbi:MAG: S-adenosylmethionine decarboxylase proenzyme [Omnitrophica WOR_2 bacterium GWF2_38_59]|nr:MAG: S-adenosylmethionine decarboxylase proenzyme [Omnitrophica WOR_2 bacterium GWF2_38_59]OGX49601.1 MAG: S-adenosylmethionine decarboxylase proenzyme [Omnitrophica WOR_2 bacterium RIFOXYA2_FULL_38_17]OGX52647.1 MAG: S-adenosylmethionine decarboxylase proenzyme [Omnitrophica WOR_2 bacterium RIFOXYA12_FULL_38_10]OGX58883.1 MAG: S-adenosylmethionine decarboxylase proenzyme [Omnitrophica WOR_2 bacterium RIFOXYB2_FULL_38_16]OGX59456.1 MAG: S-adenosylmethionine decarboxylase proenzyme [Omnitroph